MLDDKELIVDKVVLINKDPYPEGLPMKQDLFSNLKLRRNDSNISTGGRALIPHEGNLNETVKLW